MCQAGCKTRCGPGKEDVPRVAEVGGWIYGYLHTNVSKFSLIWADFPRSCPSPSRSWIQGDRVASTDMDSARQGWSIRSHRFGVTTRARGWGSCCTLPFSHPGICAPGHTPEPCVLPPSSSTGQMDLVLPTTHS